MGGRAGPEWAGRRGVPSNTCRKVAVLASPCALLPTHVYQPRSCSVKPAISSLRTQQSQSFGVLACLTYTGLYCTYCLSRTARTASPVRSGLIRPGRAGSAAHCPLCVSPVGGSSPIRSSPKRSAPLLNAPLLNAPLRPVSEQPSAPERNRTNAKEVWPLTHDRSVCAALRCAFAQRTPTIESDCPSPILSEFSSPDAACQCQPDLQLI